MAGRLQVQRTTYNLQRCLMTSLPLVLDDEPIGIILRAGQRVLRPAKIWAYCWFTDEGENGDHTHRHLPVDPKR
jgi:hypothetical protein